MKESYALIFMECDRAKPKNFLEQLQFQGLNRDGTLKPWTGCVKKAQTGISSYKEAATLAQELADASNHDVEVFFDVLIPCEEYSAHHFCQQGFKAYVSRSLVETVHPTEMHSEL